MSYTTIDYTVTDRVLILTLNRPERLNAFTVTMADELEHAFRRASMDDSVGAIVVTGAGRAFCAGMDLAVTGNVFGLDESLQPTLADMHDKLDDPAILRGVRDTGGRVTLAIFECLKPVIGAINGAAVGIGATMTLPMDVRLAAEGAKIGFVFGRLGIVPEACSSWFLPRLVGIPQALEWVYTAEPFDAAEGVRAGLLKAAVPGETLLDEARKLAHRFIDNRSPVAAALATLSACEVNESTVVVPDDYKFTTAVECSAQTGDDETCTQAEKAARESHVQAAPKFQSKEDCEKVFGDGKCETATASNSELAATD